MKLALRRTWSMPVPLAYALLAVVFVAGCGSDRPVPADVSHGGAAGTGAGPSGSGGGTGGVRSLDASATGGTATDASVPSGGVAGIDASASRLQAWQLETEGAPPLVLGVFDTAEKVHCRFVPDEKGEQRCLPDEAKNVIPTEAFADAKCAVPFFWLQPDFVLRTRGPLARPWTRPLPSQGCEPVRYQVLRNAPTARPLYGLANGVCRALSSSEQSVPSTGDLPFVAEAPDGWVKGTDTKELRLTERLRLVETVTPEGARFAKGLTDEHWAMPCTLMPGKTNGITQCFPPSIYAGSSYYADMQCKTMPIVGVPACSPAPAFIEELDKRYALSAPFVGSVYFLAKGCSLRETTTGEPTGTRYYAKGALLGDDAIAPPVPEVLTGTGRFRLRGLADPSGSFVSLSSSLLSYATPHYFDGSVNEGCDPFWDVNGKVHCVPSSVHVDVQGYFGDRDCKRPIVNCDTATCATTRFLLTRRELNGDARVSVAYGGATVLEKSDIFYRDPSGVCMQIGASVQGMAEPKGEISLDVFPVLTERYPLPSGSAHP